jgi:hypothetical protein
MKLFSHTLIDVGVGDFDSVSKKDNSFLMLMGLILMFVWWGL